MALGGFVLGPLILYLKGMRTTMFQLSGFYCRGTLTGWLCRLQTEEEPQSYQLNPKLSQA